MLQQKKMTVAIHLWMLALLSVWALPRSMAQSTTSDPVKLSVKSSAIYQQKELYFLSSRFQRAKQYNIIETLQD